MLKSILILIFIYSSNLIAQDNTEISLTGGFLPYQTYYIGAVDLETGKSDVQLFNFQLSSPINNTPYNPPIEFHVQFTVDILAPELGFRTKENLIELNTTSPIAMTHPIYLDNRDFNINSTKILDTHGNSVSMAFSIEGEFDIAEYEGLLNAVVSMGRLPDGIYDFTLKLYDFSGGQEDIIKIETIKPNRLKIDNGFNGEILSSREKNTANIKVAWLHGAKARGLKLDMQAKFMEQKTTFKGYSNYVFDDPAKNFKTEELVTF